MAVAPESDILFSQPLFPSEKWEFVGLTVDGAVLGDDNPIIAGLDDKTGTRPGTSEWWSVQTTRRHTVADTDTNGGRRALPPHVLKDLKLYAADMSNLYFVLAKAGALETVGVKVTTPGKLASPTPFAWSDTQVPGRVVAGATLVTEARAALLALAVHGIAEARAVLSDIDTKDWEAEGRAAPTDVVAVMADGMEAVKVALRSSVLAVNTLQQPALATNSAERHFGLEPERLDALTDFVVALRYFASTMYNACSPPQGIAAAAPGATPAGLLLTLSLFSATQAARTFGAEDGTVDEDTVVVRPDVLRTAVASTTLSANKATTLLSDADTPKLTAPLRNIVKNTRDVLAWLRAFGSTISKLANDPSTAAVCHGNLKQMQNTCALEWAILVAPGIKTCLVYCDVGHDVPGVADETTDAWLKRHAEPTPPLNPTAFRANLKVIAHVVRCKGATLIEDVYKTAPGK